MPGARHCISGGHSELLLIPIGCQCGSLPRNDRDTASPFLFLGVSWITEKGAKQSKRRHNGHQVRYDPSHLTRGVVHWTCCPGFPESNHYSLILSDKCNILWKQNLRSCQRDLVPLRPCCSRSQASFLQKSPTGGAVSTKTVRFPGVLQMLRG